MIIKLGEVASFVNGYAFKPSDWSDNGMPIIRIQDLTGNSYKMNRYNGDIEQKYKVQDGDVLISWSASLGVYVWHGENAVLNQHIFKVVFDKTDVSKDYFVYQIEYRLGNAASEAHGATMKHLTKSVFNALPFYLPKKEEQEKIAKVLNKITELTNKTRKQAKLLDDIIKSRFIEMFGDENNSKKWDIVNVENVADVQVGVVIKPSQYYTDKNEGIKAFRSLNVGEGYIKDSEWVYFSKEGHQKNSKSILKENDLLIVRSGTPGTACVVTKDYVGSNTIDLIIAHPNCEKVNPYYLCTFTNMPHGKKQISEGIGGAAQQHFNVGKYNKLKLMLPPMKIQNKFVEFLREIDKSKLAVQKSLDELETLKKSLMQEYFG